MDEDIRRTSVGAMLGVVMSCAEGGCSECLTAHADGFTVPARALRCRACIDA